MKKVLFSTLFTISLFSISSTITPERLQKDLAGFQIEPGLRIELITSEPLLASPVSIAFDENLKMYVVEDRGYPDPPEGGAPTKLGRIALLEDTNGDGHYDKRSEFATGLTYPNGITPWRGGVFVTCAPDIFYFKDTDGDGVADIKRVVLTGFNDTQTGQIRMASPNLGLDGWIYITGGLNGGNVSSPEHPDRPAVSFRSSDGRFNPDTYEFEVTGGRSQFGLTIDPYGRRFGSSNRRPIIHTVLEPRYLQRNSQLLFTESVEDVSKTGDDAPVFPVSKAVTTADFIPKLIGRSHAGTFTSACSVIQFNGTALKPSHQGNFFICEPAQNLVQRQIAHPEGVTFRSELPYEGREFLSSTDEWFRPVFMENGPEGALYLVDMHRKVIDHPSYVPEEARAQLDFEAGKKDGRIYRIVREDFRGSDPVKFNSSTPTTNLIRFLESTEEWQRKTAHRLLLERKDINSVGSLKKIALGSSLPESRVRALWLLRSFGSLDPATVKTALLDKEAGVREQAVLLAEALSATNPDLLKAIVTASTDNAIRVRFYSALALGSLEGPEVVSALAKIAALDGADRWVRAAVLSGIEKRMPAFIAAFREQKKTQPIAFAAVMQDLGYLVGNGGSLADSKALLRDVISGLGDYEWRISTALGLAQGLSGQTKLLEASPNGLLYAIQGNKASSADRLLLDNFINKVLGIASKQTEITRLRVLAASLLAFTNFDRSHTVLQKLLDPANAPELQLAAVSSLTRQNDARGAALLTNKNTWAGYSPKIKLAVISGLVSEPAFVQELFNAIEKGTINAAEISSVDRQHLIGDKNPAINARAAVLFKDMEGGNRMKVYEEYRKILEVPAEAQLGKAVFQRTCSACHTYAGIGGKVGPELTGVRNQPADALLLHILVPNYEVLPAYQSITVRTKDGRSLSGWLVSETNNSVTLGTVSGTKESILRTNIASLTNSGLSLMPEGLEQTMTKNEMAQLIAYLKSGG